MIDLRSVSICYWWILCITCPQLQSTFVSSLVSFLCLFPVRFSHLVNVSFHAYRLFNMQESENFEVEFKFEVFSQPHFGGDGFGIWFVNGEADPSFLSDTNALTGPIFGMKADFRGVGVMFDVYDNDGQRNNPSIFVIQNEEGVFKFSHDLDFENDMVKKVPLSDTGSKSTYSAHRCIADIRNLGRPVKAVVKFLNKVLSVYLDTDDGQGWRFCLAVEIDRKAGPKKKVTLKDTHIAFTAATGQVADHMDLLEVTTRYLKTTDKALDPSKLAHFATTSASSSLYQLLWFAITVVGLGLTAVAVLDFSEYRTMMSNNIDAVAVAQRLNQTIRVQYYAHAALVAALFITFSWFPFIINTILLIARSLQLRQNALEISPSSITRMGSKAGGVAGMTPEARFYFAMCVYVISDVIYLINMFTDA